MDLNQMHFAHPVWFWMLLVIPLVWGISFLYYRGQQPLHQLEKFIDKHLIPILLLGSSYKKKRLWPYLILWSCVWSCFVFALAGPRWDFREMTTFTKDQSLVILLDLSESMNAKDVAPSRLGRAKQKIEDLLNLSKGVKIGLIAFAADPHMIVPMTEDKETIRHLLTSLDTDLVYVQGSKLAPALEMAASMLENEPGNNQAIVVVSDGGFEDASAIHIAKKLAERNIVLYTIGVGTLEGAPVKDRQGAVVKKKGALVLSKLEKEKFREISKIGNGRYFDADHSDQVALIFNDLAKRSDVLEAAQKPQRFWEEYFYLFLLPVLPFFLWWYRRGYLFATFVLILLPGNSQASLSDYFYNGEQQANQAFENGDYSSAGNAFQDPYRKGVAYYRMGDYSSAEQMFRQSTRPEVASSAAYNIGNALVQQNKLKEAITAYENVLEKWPDHIHAKENLELVKKMLEQQEQQQDNNQNSQDKSDQQNNNQDQQQDKNKDSSEKQQNSNQDQQQDKNKNSSQKQNDEQSNDPSQEDSNSKNSETENPQRQDKPESQDSNPQSSEKEDSSQSEEEQQAEERKLTSEQDQGKSSTPSQEDLDADLWLNQIKNDPKKFLKNKFYLESKRNGTKEEIDPW